MTFALGACLNKVLKKENKYIKNVGRKLVWPTYSEILRYLECVI